MMNLLNQNKMLRDFHLANNIASYYWYHNSYVICYANVGEESYDYIVGAHGLGSDMREEYK